MKIDGFVKIPDIPGESMRDGHEDEIEIHSITFGMEAPYDKAARYVGAGSPSTWWS